VWLMLHLQLRATRLTPNTHDRHNNWPPTLNSEESETWSERFERATHAHASRRSDECSGHPPRQWSALALPMAALIGHLALRFLAHTALLFSREATGGCAILPPILPPPPQDHHVDRPIVHVDRPIVHVDRPIVHVDRPIVHVDRPIVRVQGRAHLSGLRRRDASSPNPKP